MASQNVIQGPLCYSSSISKRHSVTYPLRLTQLYSSYAIFMPMMSISSFSEGHTWYNLCHDPTVFARRPLQVNAAKTKRAQISKSTDIQPRRIRILGMLLGDHEEIAQRKARPNRSFFFNYEDYKCLSHGPTSLFFNGYMLTILSYFIVIHGHWRKESLANSNPFIATCSAAFSVSVILHISAARH